MQTKNPRYDPVQLQFLEGAFLLASITFHDYVAMDALSEHSLINFLFN